MTILLPSEPGFVCHEVGGNDYDFICFIIPKDVPGIITVTPHYSTDDHSDWDDSDNELLANHEGPLDLSKEQEFITLMCLHVGKPYLDYSL